ncbi:HEAT repeat domain-containing protein [Nocardiopsis flavescens]|nr:HEAT repeat domain-containing protein [Nocardiopsis flavescens]
MIADARLRGLDEVPWDALEGCRGERGADVREDLAAALTGTPAEAVDALQDLDDALADRGCGDRLPSAVPAALPFLVRVAADADRPRRVRTGALDLVGDVCSAWDGAPGPQAARDALLAGLPPLLTDPGPGVRTRAAQALAWTGDTAALETLRERWEDEADPGVRLRLLAAAVRLAGRVGATAGPAPRWPAAPAGEGDPEERMLVAFGSAAAAPADPVPPARAAMDDLVLRAHPPWFRAAGLGADGRDAERFRYAQVWIHRALGRAGRGRVTSALLGHPDARVRAAAVRAAVDLVGEFRSEAGRWDRGAGALLEDPDAGVRRWALRLLSTSGEGARPWADRLAARAVEPGGDAATALLTLARLGDPRALPLLLGRARLPLFGFGPVPSRDPWGWGPTFEEVLEAFAPRAGALLPHLEERMAGDPWEARWIPPSLAGWGPRAAPLADAVAGLLADHDRVPELLEVLAAIGPAAARHAPAVRGAASRSRWRAARAHLRLTGDAGASLDLLGPFSDGWREGAWGLLADAGPAAVRYEAGLRRYTDLRGPHDAAALRALWHITGDTDTVLAALLDTEHPYLGARVLTGTGLAAVRLLGEVGPPARGALPRLRALRDADRTAHAAPSAQGPRGIARDRELVALLRRAVARIGGG